MKSNNIVAFIPARGSYKGISEKNIKIISIIEVKPYWKAKRGVEDMCKNTWKF